MTRNTPPPEYNSPQSPNPPSYKSTKIYIYTAEINNKILSGTLTTDYINSVLKIALECNLSDLAVFCYNKSIDCNIQDDETYNLTINILNTNQMTDFSAVVKESWLHYQSNIKVQEYYYHNPYNVENPLVFFSSRVNVVKKSGLHYQPDIQAQEYYCHNPYNVENPLVFFSLSVNPSFRSKN